MINDYHMSGGGVRVAQPLFPVDGQGSIPMSPLQLKVDVIGIKKAVELNKLWHSRLPIYKSGCCLKAKICFAAHYKNVYFAVAIWDNPTARLIDQKRCLELKRLAISNDAPKNTASRFIKVMAYWIKKEFIEINHLISYQDVEAHNGTIYKASNWEEEHYHSGGTWYRYNSTQKRARPDLNTATGPKIRWGKKLWLLFTTLI